MNTNFVGIGWDLRIQQKKSWYFLTIPREVALGNMLKKGDKLFSYLARCDGRNALVVFLDGRERLSSPEPK